MTTSPAATAAHSLINRRVLVETTHTETHGNVTTYTTLPGKPGVVIAADRDGHLTDYTVRLDDGNLFHTRTLRVLDGPMPVLADVQIVKDEHGYTVRPVWSGTDRTDGHGYGVGKNKRLAERLQAAIRAGVVFYDIGIVTDIHGQSFVSDRSRVLGRMLNADLKRLGF